MVPAVSLLFTMIPESLWDLKTAAGRESLRGLGAMGFEPITAGLTYGSLASENGR